MWDRSITASALLAIFLGGTLPSGASWAGEAEAEPSKKAAQSKEFPLREISIFDVSDARLLSDLTAGARGACQEQPYEEVKAYPNLHSKKPFYGLLRLFPDPDNHDSGTPLYFVVDESGQKPAAAAPPRKESPEQEKEEKSLLDTLGEALFGKSEKSKPPEPPQLKNTYDRLFIDLNGDLDLTNDPVVTPMNSPPEGAVRRYSSIRQAVVFEEISVPADLGGEYGEQTIRLIPRFQLQEYQGKEYPGVALLSATARMGTIKLGSEAYQAILAQRYVITGTFDNPYTALLLTAPGNSNRENWWGADQLNAMRLVDGTYYTTSTTPIGDKLIVTPYDGPMGVLRIGAGDRDLDKMSIQGSLQSERGTLAVGTRKQSLAAMLDATSECELPCGEYLPSYVSITYGDLRLSISQNYHADGVPRGSTPKSWIYGIELRKDKPFVWDFSTRPDVMFASPAKEQTFKPGDEINVMAVLVDPKLGVMIRRLNKQTKSLDPTVTITNAAGKQIAEGPMPFG